MEDIRPGVRLETRAYGDVAGAPTLVVWGHGLCNALAGEDSERLWDFWAAMRADDLPRTTTTTTHAGGAPASMDGEGAMRVVRYAARGHGNSSAASAAEDCTWRALGRDMLTLGRRLRRDVNGQKLVLGGASMGSASAIWAAVHALEDARKAAEGDGDASAAGPAPDVAPTLTDTISGLVLVILPTFHESRLRRKEQIVAAAERGYAATAGRKSIRPIFKGTHRESEPPQPLGVREDSFAAVMAGGAASDLPPRDVVAAAVAAIPTVVLSWDCGDRTHPESSALAFKAMALHARVHIARSLEDTAAWPGLIREFITGL